MKAKVHSFNRSNSLNRRRRHRLKNKLAKKRQRDRREVLFFQQEQSNK